MSTHDPLSGLFADFDRPAAPRVEFAEELWARLDADLRPVSRAVGLGRRWRLWPRQPAIPGRRLVLVAFILLFLLAGAATATYLGVHQWVSTGPRGVQVSGAYRLTAVYADRGSEGPVAPWALSPDGHELVGLRYTYRSGKPAQLVRVAGVDGSRHPAPVSSPLSAFADPHLWPDGVTATVGATEDPWVPRAETLAFAPNGDLFLLLEATDWGGADPARFGRDASLIVIGREGRRQKIVTFRELVSERLGPPRRFRRFAVAASASDRVWLRVDIVDDPYQQKQDPKPLVHTLFEIVDPNADGDWSDRIVHRVSFPAALRSMWAVGADSHFLGMSSFVADPGDGGSVLDMVTGPGPRVRVVQLADRNGDGDVADPGELKVRLDRDSASGGLTRMAVPARSSGGSSANRIVFAGLTHTDRVSVLLPSGRLTDIGRSFPGQFRGLAAGTDGSIYAATFNDLDAPRSVTKVYRLAPSTAGAVTAHRELSPRVATPPVSDPLIAAVVLGADGSPTTHWLPAQGGLRRTAVDIGPVCPSADGRTVAFQSDLVAPFENFTYVGPAKGGVPAKVSERQGELHCGWAGRWLVIASPGGSSDGPAVTLHRVDTRSRADIVLARNVGRYSISPDGLQIVFVDRSAGPGRTRERLELIDVASLAQHELAGPVAGRTYGIPLSGYVAPGAGFAWSTDSRRIAYVSSTMPWRPAWWAKQPNPRQRFTISMQEIGDRAPTRARQTVPWPSLSWSPDGHTLLVCERGAASPDAAGGCSTAGFMAQFSSLRLAFVDTETGSVRAVRPPAPSSDVVFAAWAPSGGALAYATSAALWLRGPTGAVRKLANAPADGWPIGDWIGWSPDGRYIGLATVGPTESSPDVVAVVDVQDRRTRTLLRTRSDRGIQARWWHP